MAEYIERAKIVEYLRSRKGNFCDDIGKYWSTGMEAAASACEKFPAADVAPMVRGRWIPAEPESDVIFICSKCETEISTSWDYDQAEMWNYCPNCGAKMEG